MVHKCETPDRHTGKQQTDHAIEKCEEVGEITSTARVIASNNIKFHQLDRI